MNVTELRSTTNFAIDFRNGMIPLDTIKAREEAFSIETVRKTNDSERYVVIYTITTARRSFYNFFKKETIKTKKVLSNIQALIDTSNNSIMGYDYAHESELVFYTKDQAEYYINDVIDSILFKISLDELVL